MASKSNESNNPAKICDYLPEGPLKNACTSMISPPTRNVVKKKKAKPKGN